MKDENNSMAAAWDHQQKRIDALVESNNGLEAVVIDLEKQNATLLEAVEIIAEETHDMDFSDCDRSSLLEMVCSDMLIARKALKEIE